MQDAFREALKQADEVFLAPPHRADKLGEERFDSEGVAAVDTIYYDSRLNLHQVSVDRTQIDHVWPSDHFPIIAQFNE
jgi:endonuclease/exonuclease/phosphatase family metal-dependent hydrolase